MNTYVIYGNISLNSSKNKKCFRLKLQRKLSKSFQKIGHLQDEVGKYATARWATDDKIIQRAEDMICVPDN